MSRCLLVLLFALVVRAQEQPPQYHFLFIVDTSISMADRKQASIVAVRDVIRSFFGVQIEPGDLLDIWTRDNVPEEERFPALEWNPRRGGTILTIVGDYLAATKFHRGNHMLPVLKELRKFAPTTKGLIVVLLTDGEEEVSGFDFDAELNHEIAKLRQDATKARRPILIGLSAIDGEFVEWRAKIGADPAVVPRLPKREKPTPPAPAPVVQAAPETILPKWEPEPERPSILNLPPGAKIVAAPVQVPEPLPTRREVPPEPRIEPVVAQAKIVAAPPVVTPAVAAPPVPTVAPNVIEKPAENPKPALVTLPPVVTTKTQTPVVELVIKTNSSANIASTVQQAASATAPSVTEPFFLRPVYILGGVGGALVFAAGLLALNSRGTKRESASLISRSLAK